MKPCLDCGTPTQATRCPPCRSYRNRQRGSATERGYDSQYQRERQALLATNPTCWQCDQPATTADHVPPLRDFPHPSLWTGELRPACAHHNYGRHQPP